MVLGLTLVPHVVNALAWACLLHWPWGALFPALTILFAVHVAQPIWSTWIGDQPTRRAFVRGPLVLFATDGVFLIAAWQDDTWGGLTAVFVPVLVGVAVLALGYSASVMSLTGGRGSRRG